MVPFVLFVLLHVVISRCDETQRTINCSQEKDCTIICNEKHCINAQINCPVNNECNITCDTRLCHKTIINATKSSLFNLYLHPKLQSNLTVYLPSSSSKPLTHIHQTSLFSKTNTFTATERDPSDHTLLTFYAIHGFNDLISDTKQFTHGFMYCQSDFSSVCNFSSTSWSCIEDTHLCSKNAAQKRAKVRQHKRHLLDTTNKPVVYPTKAPTHAIYHGSVQIHNESFVLFMSDVMWSSTNTAKFMLQTGGNLVFRRYKSSYNNNKAVWSTKTNDDNITHIEISNTGNVMVKDSVDNIYWQSNTSAAANTTPLELVITDNCPYLYNKYMDIVWSPCTDCGDISVVEQWEYVTIPINGSYKMCVSDRIFSRYSISSGTRFKLRTSGSLSLTNISRETEVKGDLWETVDTSAIYAEFNHNGNIMLKGANDQIKWQSNTLNTAQLPLRLVVTDYCVYLRNMYEVIWKEGICMESIVTSFAPTLSPSAITVYPTISPTIYPTEIPSTAAPSFIPTHVPSSTAPILSPTTEPALIPITLSPSTEDTVAILSSADAAVISSQSTQNILGSTGYFGTETSVNEAVDYTGKKENYTLLVVIFLSTMLCTCAVAIIVMFLYKSKRKNKQDLHVPSISKVNSISANVIVTGSDNNEAIVLESVDNKVTCDGSEENILKVQQKETQRDVVSKTPGNIAPDEFEVIGDDEVDEDHDEALRPEGAPVITQTMR